MKNSDGDQDGELSDSFAEDEYDELHRDEKRYVCEEHGVALVKNMRGRAVCILCQVEENLL